MHLLTTTLKANNTTLPAARWDRHAEDHAQAQAQAEDHAQGYGQTQG